MRTTLCYATITLLALLLVGDAFAQGYGTRQSRGPLVTYDGVSGMVQTTIVTRNPLTGRLETASESVNPWTGARYTTSSTYNPFTRGRQSQNYITPPQRPQFDSGMYLPPRAEETKIPHPRRKIKVIEAIQDAIPAPPLELPQETTAAPVVENTNTP